MEYIIPGLYAALVLAGLVIFLRWEEKKVREDINKAMEELKETHDEAR
jgi:hypothetical protein